MKSNSTNRLFSVLYKQTLDQYADFLALCDNEKSLTYIDLDRISGNIACYLKKQNIKENDIVAIYSDRSIEFIASVLAIFRLGAAYVTIDTSYPQSRVNFIIEDSKAKVVLKAPDAGALSFNDAEVLEIHIDELNSEYDQFDSLEKPQNLAYLIYTSGSTGTPKGAMVRYDNFLNTICWQKDFYSIVPDDRTSWIARPAFDASLFEIWAYLISGASIAIPDKELLYEPPRLLDWINQKQLTICFMPTPLAESCLEIEWPREISLRYLFCGGDALRKYPDPSMKFKMYDHYGPSECTIVTSIAEIKPLKEGESLPLYSNIGFPISGNKMHVMTDNMEEAESGEIGEICITGKGVGSGYLNNKELTAEKFIKNPFSSDKNSRMYRSGDLGKLLEDGTIEFHGRIDRQVKIRGHRIELGEIENQLLSYTLVKDAAVVASEGGSTQKKIVAFIVSENGESDDLATEAKKYLSDKIAAYMMPTQIIETEQLPMSINGKIDRLALSKMATTGQTEAPQMLPKKATNETEEEILNIFKEVIACNINIGPDDNFFDMGGDSLKAGKAVAYIRKQFNIEFSVLTFFSNPTAAETANIIRSASKNKSDIIAIDDIERDDDIAVSQGQMHMLLLNDMSDDNSVCNIVTVMDIDGFVDNTTLENAINQLIDRQQMLRSRFVLSDTGYNLVIEDELQCQLDYEDIIRVRAENKPDRIEKIISKYSHANFDIHEAPLCRFVLIRIEDTHFKLVSVFHHAIGDGWSMGVYVKELLCIYESLAKGTKLKLEPLQAQYPEYIKWFREWLNCPEAKTQLEYWQKQLADGNFTLDLNNANPRTDTLTFNGSREYFSLPEDVTVKLEEICHKYGVTMYMVLSIVYALTLRFFSGQDKLIIGSPVANRIIPEIENIIGLFINSVAVKFDFGGKFKFTDILAETKKTALEAFENQNIPFEMVVDKVKPARDSSRHPIYQHLFIYQNAHVSSGYMNGLKIRFDEIGSDSAKLDLTLDAMKRNDIIEYYFEYNTDIFSKDSIKQFADKFFEFASQIAENPLFEIESKEAGIEITSKIAKQEKEVEISGELIIQEDDGLLSDESVAEVLTEDQCEAAVENEIVDDDAYVKKMSFWVTHLENSEEPLILKNAKPRPQKNNSNISVFEYSFPDEIYSRIKSMSDSDNCSSWDIILGAYVALMYEYSGQKNIVIGADIPNKTCNENISSDIGNNVALHFKIDSQMSLADILEQSKDLSSQAKKNQLPFDMIVKKLISNPHESYHPIFQYMLVCEDPKSSREYSSKLDLLTRISQTEDSFKIAFNYNSDIFTEEAIELMAEHYVDLLDLLTVEPDRTIDQLPVFEPQVCYITPEKMQRKENFMSFIDMFLGQVSDVPDNLALRDKCRKLNYRQLNHITNILADELSKRGVQGGYVGIYCGRSLDFIVCALAVLKSGAGYVTLDTEYPSQRLDFMIEDAGIKAVLKPSEISSKISSNIEIIDVDINLLLEKPCTDNLYNDISGEDPAYAIYTSGSTGKPKGVEIQHKNLIHLINWQINYYDITPDDRASHLARPSFDTSVSEIWPYLASGAAVIIPDEDIILNPPRLIEWIDQNSVTISDMTTPLAEIVISEQWSDQTSLRILKTGGDRLHKRPPKNLPFEFINEYGPTECTVITTAGIVESESQDKSAPDIGCPIDGASVYILNEELEPVDEGQEGEIFIGGEGVAKGYINRQELTKEKFLPDPFAEKCGAKMYRSGDLGRFLPDGNIEFIGRSDFQVQIRGFRVELGEIENAIISSGKVREAAVVALEQSGNTVIKAYIVSESPDGQVPSGLLSYLKQNLPDYMVPSSFFLLGQLPLTANGKVDRNALRYFDCNNENSQQSQKTQKASPRNHIEQVLHDIWKELLEKDDIGIYDDFFDIGGHSLLIIRMAGMLEKHGFKLRVTKIFEYSKIATLASYLKFGDSNNSGTSHEELVVLRKGENNRLPLFFIHTVEGDMLFYSNLIGYMDKSQPCYGILDRGIFDADKKIKTIEEMAKHYTDLIIQRQPQGPYMLVGYCFAGFIAYEIARNLKSMGKKVKLLGVIETPVCNVPLNYLPYYVQRFKHIIKFLPVKIKELINREAKLIDEYEIDDGFIFDVWEGVSNDNKWLENMRRTHKSNMESTETYMFKPYDDEIALYIANKRKMWRSKGKDLGWASLTKKVDIVEVESLHKDISMPPHIETIATDIKARIDVITQGL